MFEKRAVRRLGLTASAALSLLAPCGSVEAAAAPEPRTIAPLAAGDEPIVVTQHVVKTVKGALRYEAHAGRLALRDAQSGEVRGHVFFVAYIAQNRSGPRPLTFIWNGGPLASSMTLHSEALGPRRITDEGFVDNAETLLSSSDLVFYDPVGTGFSRPAKPEFAKQFLSVLGDFTATTEFIRAYRTKFRAEAQPVYLLGESYGTWRAGGVAELMAKRGDPVAGVVLVSGGIPGSMMPTAFSDAMFVPARTATAFVQKRLAPDLMADREATMRAVDAFVRDTYLPALSNLGEQSPEQREAIAQQLARFMGVQPDLVDRNTLVMSNLAYRKAAYGEGREDMLDTFDMRLKGGSDPVENATASISQYLRGELGYATDLPYDEPGYTAVGETFQSTGERFLYDHVKITPEAMARAQAGGGPPSSQPWLQNAMRQMPKTRVFVAAGRYDSLNMCEGNEDMVATLEAPVASRFETHCYEGGHMMYRDGATRLQLAQDLAKFFAKSKP